MEIKDLFELFKFIQGATLTEIRDQKDNILLVINYFDDTGKNIWSGYVDIYKDPSKMGGIDWKKYTETTLSQEEIFDKIMEMNK